MELDPNEYADVDRREVSPPAPVDIATVSLIGGWRNAGDG